MDLQHKGFLVMSTHDPDDCSILFIQSALFDPTKTNLRLYIVFAGIYVTVGLNVYYYVVWHFRYGSGKLTL